MQRKMVAIAYLSQITKGDDPWGGNGSGDQGGRNKSTGNSDRSAGDAGSANKGSKYRGFKLGERLERALAKKRFFRVGYYELDRHEAVGEISMRGECNEEATEDHRRNFPNEQ